jgi:hypothetical protein
MASVTRGPGARQSRRKPAHGVARLMLVINGTNYTIRRIPCDPDAALQAWRLRKRDGTHYNIARTEHGPTCDCPDWIFSRDGLDPRGCKHILALTVVGLLGREGSAK